MAFLLPFIPMIAGALGGAATMTVGTSVAVAATGAVATGAALAATSAATTGIVVAASIATAEVATTPYRTTTLVKASRVSLSLTKPGTIIVRYVGPYRDRCLPPSVLFALENSVGDYSATIEECKCYYFGRSFRCVRRVQKQGPRFFEVIIIKAVTVQPRQDVTTTSVTREAPWKTYNTEKTEKGEMHPLTPTEFEEVDRALTITSEEDEELRACPTFSSVRYKGTSRGQFISMIENNSQAKTLLKLCDV